MLDQIVAAIEEMRRLEIYYEPGSRSIEPHAVGYSKDGNVLVRAYQTAGASASGEHMHWKLFRLDRMTSVHRTSDRFNGPRDGYRTGDKAMKGGIIAQLPPRNRSVLAS